VLRPDSPAARAPQAEFGYRHGVRRQHLRVLFTAALATAAAELQALGRGGAVLAPRLYELGLACAAAAAQHLTRHESGLLAELQPRLKGLGRAWLLDFRQLAPTQANGPAGAAGWISAIVELLALAQPEGAGDAAAELAECVVGAAERWFCAAAERAAGGAEHELSCAALTEVVGLAGRCSCPSPAPHPRGLQPLSLGPLGPLALSSEGASPPVASWSWTRIATARRCPRSCSWSGSPPGPSRGCWWRPRAHCCGRQRPRTPGLRLTPRPS
jgi:hypothetical protein